jgi:hypothetical protein
MSTLLILLLVVASQCKRIASARSPEVCAHGVIGACRGSTHE